MAVNGVEWRQRKVLIAGASGFKGAGRRSTQRTLRPTFTRQFAIKSTLPRHTDSLV